MIDDARGSDDELRRQRPRRLGERDVDGHRNDRERLRPDHHDREGRRAPGLGQFAEIFGMSGMLESGLIERGLGDRVGHQSARLALAHRFDGALDRFERRRARWPRPGARARRRPGFSAGPPAGRPRNAAPAPAGSVSMIGTARPARLAAAARTPGGANTTKGAPGVRSRHAASASSGPIPAGSPMVIANGGLSPVMFEAPRASSPARRSADQRPTFVLTSPRVRSTSWIITVWLRVDGFRMIGPPANVL